jgi:hypothetical protein
MNKGKMAVWLLVLMILQGCGASEMAARNREVHEENRQVYEMYRAYQESTNLQRQKAGLPPRPVKDYDEWRRSPGTD